ncbi:hypothetical protein [Pseudomonas sp. RC10]|uniref:hypothetical protein n=1 Tax=Pseudomonas bambusae TaxID=3139142 RepID=UPI003138CC14
MELTIEFPVEQDDIFTQPSHLPQGFCICYQHNVDDAGYGPYGFHTAKSEILLKRALGPLTYWNSERGQLVDADIPKADGIYFFREQGYVTTMNSELMIYQKSQAIQALRDRYKKTSPSTPSSAKPILLEVAQGRRMSGAAISKILENNCSFLISYSRITEMGQILIFFDTTLRANIRKTAEEEGIKYITEKSIDDLKPW